MNSRLTLLLLLLALASGCSDGRPTRVPVSGRVTIDGAPLTRGFVQVIPDNARAAWAHLDAGGRFELATFDDVPEGCVLGKHRVVVISREVLSPTKIRWLAPQKYASADATPLTVTIAGPVNDLEIPLTWDGGKPFVEETITQGDASGLPGPAP